MFFYVDAFSVLMHTSKGAMFVAADVQLFDVVTREFLTMIERAQIATPSLIPLLSQARLNVAGKPVINIGLLKLKKCTFLCNLIFLTTMEL